MLIFYSVIIGFLTVSIKEIHLPQKRLIFIFALFCYGNHLQCAIGFVRAEGALRGVVVERVSGYP